jgi:hypothetical protein
VRRPSSHLRRRASHENSKILTGGFGRTIALKGITRTAVGNAIFGERLTTFGAAHAIVIVGAFVAHVMPLVSGHIAVAGRLLTRASHGAITITITSGIAITARYWIRKARSAFVGVPILTRVIERALEGHAAQQDKASAKN